MTSPQQPAYVFSPEERAILPGGPATPRLSPLRRGGFAVAALVTGLAATLGNAMLSVNVNTLGGSLGLDPVQMNWMLAFYVAMVASANLLLIRARVTFGIPRVVDTLLIGAILAITAHLIFRSIATEILVQLMNGLTAAGLIAVTIYNMIECIPAAKRPMALALAFGIPQLSVPIARMIPVELLAFDNWRGLTLIELGLALLALGSLHLVPLPPNERQPALRPLDVLTLALFAAGMVLLCGVITTGRLVWWRADSDTGLLFVAAIALIAAAFAVESRRREPLLALRWLTARDSLRFAAVTLLVRLALAEQTYGSVGLLGTGGLTDDQLHRLFAIVLVAMICGTLIGTFCLTPIRQPLVITLAALMIAIGAFGDSFASNLTRPQQFYLDQGLIALGSSLFLGPALIFGFSRMLKRGPQTFVIYVIVFGATQNLGSIVGSALLASYQIIRARAHFEDLAARLTADNPLVQARLHGGPAALAQVVTREANILAFNDAFRLVAALAAAIALYMAYRTLQQVRQLFWRASPEART